MARLELFMGLAISLILAASTASAAIIEHSLHVQNLTVRRLCHPRVITAVNGSLPGPTIRVSEGDTLVVHVFNKSPYNLTIHWHGIFQLLSAWADGPSFITQCPIPPGSSYTYRFTITGQEGTLWWHAHVSWLRASVYGALIIHPKKGHLGYPFPKPYKEVPLILGEWWNANVVDVEDQALALGVPPNISDAFTINGQPGDLYPCSRKHTYKLKVRPGKTYLLRMINAALNNQLFFKIADHKLKVVAVDASYTNPYVTDVIVLSPGQTADVLLTADQIPGSYYMAGRNYFNAENVPLPFDNTTTTGILLYKGTASLPGTTPKMPLLPAFNDTPTAHKFSSSLTSLVGAPHWIPVPAEVDEKMFMTISLGLSPCGGRATCQGPNGLRFSASMNNVSFQAPTGRSLLEAAFFGLKGFFTTDFPDTPPLAFDYTNRSLAQSPLGFVLKGTRVKKLKYNATVEIVLQNTAFIGVENHPMHLHGFNFHVLAQGFGNFNPANDRKKFNFVNPVIRNTIGVPVGGWAVIRFQANNPGVWMFHCHLDVHLPWGLATVFVVEDGPTPSSTLPPPPADLPKC
ncbi:hypothetical protein SAY87_014816 [Trapa incisa]|uniref:Laccase n=1 Tax=Trapa incisa TaxID=236973 RepID=A0AAN7GXP3_9MYRT|nr:hypothetical protein SAY87_014816 [Trapa incisa]